MEMVWPDKGTEVKAGSGPSGLLRILSIQQLLEELVGDRAHSGFVIVEVRAEPRAEPPRIEVRTL